MLPKNSMHATSRAFCEMAARPLAVMCRRDYFPAMATEVLYVSTDETEGIVRDLDDVVLLADAMTDDGVMIPRGTRGTVVGVWKEDALFEVEFPEPPGALATIAATNLQLTRQRGS